MKIRAEGVFSNLPLVVLYSRRKNGSKKEACDSTEEPDLVQRVRLEKWFFVWERSHFTPMTEGPIKN